MQSRNIYRIFCFCGRIAGFSIGDQLYLHNNSNNNYYFNQLRFLVLPHDVNIDASSTAGSTLSSSESLNNSGGGEKNQNSNNIGNRSGSENEEGFGCSNSSSMQGGAANEQIPQFFTGNDFPFKLYGEDTRASIDDSNRVFSSSTTSSYDRAAFVQEALVRELRDVTNGNNNNNNNNNNISDSRQTVDMREFLVADPQQKHTTVASVAAAAAMAMTGDVKKSHDHAPPAVFQQPPPQQQLPKKKPPAKGSKSSDVLENSKKENSVMPDSYEFINPVDAAITSEKEVEKVKEKDQLNLENDDDKIKREEGKEGEVEASAMLSPSVNDGNEGEVHVFVRDHMRNTIVVDRLHSFKDIENKLPLWLQKNIKEAGYTTPTIVQSFAIPLFMEKRDVVGVAPTGSGKTVAFALPALAALVSTPPLPSTKKNNNDGTIQLEPHILVLCPTRELVQQTRGVLSQLGGNVVRVKGAFGGQDREKQLSYLQRWGGCEVLVSTPGRLCDFVESGDISLKVIDFLIMDEADRMLELGFASQLEFIMSNINKYKRPRQTTMWTATWNATVGGLASRFMLPERVMLEVDREHKTNTDITQYLYAMQDASQRISAIVDLYNNGIISKRQQVLIFVNRKEVVEQLAEELRKALQAPPDLVQCLHGGMKQRKREAILHGFKEGAIRILCATDIAARGLDVPALEHVINYDLPRETDTYVHRIGRTGRAGRHGTAHTFIIAGDALVPPIARFIAAQTGNILPDDVQAIIHDVELRGGTINSNHNNNNHNHNNNNNSQEQGEAGRRYKSHARLAGRDWRVPGNKTPTLAQNSKYVRGIGQVVTLRRPTPRKDV